MKRYYLELVDKDYGDLLEMIEIEIHGQFDIDSLTSPLGSREIAEQVQAGIQKDWEKMKVIRDES